MKYRTDACLVCGEPGSVPDYLNDKIRMRPSIRNDFWFCSYDCYKEGLYEFMPDGYPQSFEESDDGKDLIQDLRSEYEDYAEKYDNLRRHRKYKVTDYQFWQNEKFGSRWIKAQIAWETEQKKREDVAVDDMRDRLQQEWENLKEERKQGQLEAEMKEAERRRREEEKQRKEDERRADREKREQREQERDAERRAEREKREQQQAERDAERRADRERREALEAEREAEKQRKLEEEEAEERLKEIEWDEILETKAIPNKKRYEHTHILAPSGFGKTTLMEQMILSDYEPTYINDLYEPNPPVHIIIDPKGLMVERLRRLLVFSEQYSGKLVVIDAFDKPALNLFDSLGRDPAQLISDFSYIFSTTNQKMTGKQTPCFAFCARLLFTIPHANLFTLLDLLNDGTNKRARNPLFQDAISKLTEAPRRFFEDDFY
jgi:hypothetical protein